MTRAKYALKILIKGVNITEKKEYVEYALDKTPFIYEEKIFTHEMSLADISLGFDVDKYKGVEFFASNRVSIERRDSFHNHCIVYKNRVLGTFSNAFEELISKKFKEGYTLESAEIKYVVVWFDTQKVKNLRHALCKIVLKKNNSVRF